MKLTELSAPTGARTPDTLLKRQVLCRLSYWGVCTFAAVRVKMAGAAGLEPANGGVKVRCVTTSPRPCMEKLNGIGVTQSRFLWGGIWDSNPRHPEPQSGALPTELIPPYLVRQKGLEPPAYCLEGSCSIQLSYWRIYATAFFAGAGEGNRTLVSSLEGWCSTIELHPQALK